MAGRIKGTSAGAGSLCVVGPLTDDTVSELKARLDAASDAFARVQKEGQLLDGSDAETVAEKMERLGSQLLEVTAPVSMSEVYQRLDAVPASEEEFAELARHMQAPDHEG
jgi:hypothetical protein